MPASSPKGVDKMTKEVEVKVVNTKRVSMMAYLEWSDMVKIGGHIFRLNGSVGNNYSKWYIEVWSPTNCAWSSFATAKDVPGINAFGYTDVMSYNRNVNPSAETNFAALLTYVKNFIEFL